MRGKALSLVAAAALLASVGIANAADATANAKGPVTLTDNQLDKVTAGATAAGILANSTAALNSIVANANSPAALNNLLAVTAQTVGFLMTP